MFVLLNSAPAARRKAVSSRMFSGAKYLFAGDILNCFPAALLVPAKGA
jgi:hypothetical protein